MQLLQELLCGQSAEIYRSRLAQVGFAKALILLQPTHNIIWLCRPSSPEADGIQHLLL